MLPWKHACHEANCLFDITAWMPVGEGWIAWIGTIHWNPRLSLLTSSKLQIIFTNGHAMVCSNLGDLVYTCMLCASHSNSRLITGIRTHVFLKTKYHVSNGRSLIGRAGVLIAWPSPLVSKFLSRGNFGDDGHVAVGTSQRFLNLLQNKIFWWRLFIWQSSPCLALLFLKKYVSQNDLQDFDSLVQD